MCFILREDAQTSCLDFGAQEQFDVLERAAKAHILTPESLPDEFGDARTDYRDVEKGNHLWLKGFGAFKRRPLPTKQLQKLLWNVHISRVMADAIVRRGNCAIPMWWWGGRRQRIWKTWSQDSRKPP